MTKPWRPDDWKTIRHAKDLMTEPFDGRLPTAQTIYEAGADAMYPFAYKKGQKDLAKELIELLTPYSNKDMSLNGAIWLMEKHLKEKGLL